MPTHILQVMSFVNRSITERASLSRMQSSGSTTSRWFAFKYFTD